jgi:TatD DNase family protein
MPTLFDTHAHLTSPELVSQAPQLLKRAQAAGVCAVVNICTDESSFRAGQALRRAFPWVYLAAATTPHDAQREGDPFFSVVEAAARAGELVAVGETGLDYFYKELDPLGQQKVLSRYFALAKEAQLPLIFHCRDAFHDLFQQADDEYKEGPALLHCFTGTLNEAKQVLERGWLISLSGIVTFKKSDALRQVAAYAPLDQLGLETDSPYLAPQAHRGQSNEPAFVLEVARAVAVARGLSVEAVAEATSHTARTFFRLEKKPE